MASPGCDMGFTSFVGFLFITEIVGTTAVTGLCSPLRTYLPTGSICTSSSTTAEIRLLTSICIAFTSLEKRDARFVTVPMGVYSNRPSNPVFPRVEKPWAIPIPMANSSPRLHHRSGVTILALSNFALDRLF